MKWEAFKLIGMKREDTESIELRCVVESSGPKTPPRQRSIVSIYSWSLTST